MLVTEYADETKFILHPALATIGGVLWFFGMLMTDYTNHYMSIVCSARKIIVGELYLAFW